MNTSQPQLNSLPDSDLELLSAYIDDQLDATARSGLERRLGAEPRLRAELAELRAATSLLRELEPLPPPRSFTLSPAVARRRPFLSLAWTMQLGGGLAGFALVLLASVQMLVGMGMGAAAPAPPPAAMQAQSTAMAPMSAEAFGVAEATQAPAATADPAALEMAPAPAAEPAATIAPAAAALPESPQDTTAARSAEAGATMAGDAAVGGAAASSAAAPTDAPTAAIAASEPSSPDTANPAPPDLAQAKQAPAPVVITPALLFGLGLALLAVALGAFLYRRSRS